MRSIIIQQAGGDFLPLLDFNAAHWGRYAAIWSMDYWSLRHDLPHRHHHHWDRIELLNHSFNMGYELVVWADVDTIPVRFDEDIRTVLTSGTVGMCWHEIPFYKWSGHYNVGLFCVRQTLQTRALIDAAWQLAPLEPWHEQGAFNLLLREDPRFIHLLQRLDNRWNSTHRAGNEVPDPIVRAWHGTGDAAWRLAQMKEAVHT